MKQIIAIFLASLMFVACGNTKYRITGTIEGAAEGDSIILGYSNDGLSFTTVSKSAIKNGEFLFEGSQQGCKVYYLGYEDGEAPFFALFFLEPGEINAKISAEGSHITGSPMNDLNIALEDSLRMYVLNMMSYQDALYSDTTLTEEKRAELGNKSYIAQREAMTFIRNTIYDNIENMVGLFMLVQYSDLFDNNELKELVASVPEENIDPENNALYDILLEIQEERNSPETLDEIIDTIEKEGEDFEMQDELESEVVE